MRWLKYNKTDHKTHFISDANSYMFRHQVAIFREFINRILVPKYVGFVTWYEVCLVFCLIVFYSVHIVGFHKYGMWEDAQYE
jgi:hypothetical protein